MSNDDVADRDHPRSHNDKNSNADPAVHRPQGPGNSHRRGKTQYERNQRKHQRRHPENSSRSISKTGEATTHQARGSTTHNAHHNDDPENPYQQPKRLRSGDNVLDHHILHSTYQPTL